MSENGKRPAAKLLMTKVTMLFKPPVGLAVAYFCSSVLLATLITLRLNFTSSVWTDRLNVYVYFFTYYVIPLLTFMWLFMRIHHKSDGKMTNKVLFLVCLETFASFMAVVSIFLFASLPEYIILPMPLVIVFAVYLIKYRPAKTWGKLVAPLLVLMIVASFFLPMAAASIGYDQIIARASGIKNKEDQVRFIAGNMLATTTETFNVVRANNDFEKLLLCGDGACGEAAMSMVTYLRALGFNAMEVGFPGEDHEFVEVEMNGTWLVVDPGYNMTLVPIAARAEARVQEAGTISYVAAYTADGFTELTQQYVNTDTIVVRVTQYGEPVADASVTFVHTLVTDGNARSMELPGNGFSFHTDINGTVTIRLGKIGANVYQGSFTQTQPYYVVYVNGKSTQQKVTSTGTGITAEINIDLTRP
ncbi:MAG TPA: transglutaminase domain-containing protein [Candidatus Acidoferrales bacterium]|nr:transglutaminase domain-containing protein [Candidatus Acidoferrales bacterium]